MFPNLGTWEPELNHIQSAPGLVYTRQNEVENRGNYPMY